MSELLDRITAEQLQARKDRNKVRAAVLTSLMSDASKLSAEDAKKGVKVDDARVVSTLKIFIANAEFTAEKTAEELARVGDGDVVLATKLADIRYEIEVLNEFLPSQLDEAALRVIIDAWKSQGKGLGEIMASLKTEYGGQYDGKLASSIAKA